MVHWIWLIVAGITGAAIGFILLGLVSANGGEHHRKWTNEDE